MRDIHDQEDVSIAPEDELVLPHSEGYACDVSATAKSEVTILLLVGSSEGRDTEPV